MAKDKDVLTEAKEAFRQAADAENDNREQWQDDVRFARLGEQWPESVKRQREIEGRPCLTFNRMPVFIRQVVNDARQNKPSIKIHPVGNGADKQTAEILQGLIRNVEVSSNADVAYDTAIEHSVSGGFGYLRINVDYAADDVFDQDVRIERVTNPLSVYGDPYSTAADSSDWNTAFVTEQYTREEFERRWKGADTAASWDAQDDGDKIDDWFGEETIRVAEYWTRSESEHEILLLNNGQVMTADEWERQTAIWMAMGLSVTSSRVAKTMSVTQRIITGAEVLETNTWRGKYIPIVPVYGDEINVDGRRYFQSLIRHARSAQESYNYWRTSAVEKVALDTKSPWVGQRGAFKNDAEKWATSNVRNHAFLEYDGPQPPFRAPSGGVPASDVQMALQASDDLKSIIGIYDASLGARSNETSGRAIIARQREGDVSTYHFIDNLSRALRHTGRILVDLIPHVYNQPRIVRILGEDGESMTVPVNQQIPGVERIYDLTAGKYDVTITTGPSYTTRREEAAVQMTEMVRAFPGLAQIAGDLLVKNLDWPGADELAKRLKATIPMARGDDPQMQAMKQQMGQVVAAGKEQIAKLQQDAQKLAAQNAQLQAENKNKSIEAELKAEELKIKAFEAETDRMQANMALYESRQPGNLSADIALLEQQMQTMQSYIGQLTGTLQAYSAPKQKTARAVKMPDGSWMMESIEHPTHTTEIPEGIEAPEQGEIENEIQSDDIDEED